MSIKLTYTQLVMLSAAAQRDDRCLVATQNLKGGAAPKVAAKLIAAGLVKEIKAKAGMPVWRRDEQAARSYALKLTAAGAKAIVVDAGSSSQGAGEEASGCHMVVLAHASRVQHSSLDASAPDSAPSAGSPPAAPRSGTKIAQVIALLERDIGATLNELVAATGWLPHTARAALTGLRKRGYAAALDRSNAERGSTYLIRMGRAAAAGDVNSGQDAAGDKDAAGRDNPPAGPAAPLRAAKRQTASRARAAA